MALDHPTNVATQIPASLARKLDAMIDAERARSPLGTVNRSTAIRAALAAFLENVPDPKDQPESPKRGYTRRPAPAPEITRHPAPVRTRTRRALPVAAE
ncbi:hypothetical protein DFI02_13511 [Rhizobium sp. PP-F2F-G20b]|nr:hypothetical protein DFI02_13511 [Rhizobium sp. PP-F2F-G20b]